MWETLAKGLELMPDDDFDTESAEAIVVRDGWRSASDLCQLFITDVDHVVGYATSDSAWHRRTDELCRRARVAFTLGDWELLDDLAFIAESVLADATDGSMWVEWCDGYVIYSRVPGSES